MPVLLQDPEAAAMVRKSWTCEEAIAMAMFPVLEFSMVCYAGWTQTTKSNHIVRIFHLAPWYLMPQSPNFGLKSMVSNGDRWWIQPHSHSYMQYCLDFLAPFPSSCHFDEHCKGITRAQGRAPVIRNSLSRKSWIFQKQLTLVLSYLKEPEERAVCHASSLDNSTTSQGFW